MQLNKEQPLLKFEEYKNLFYYSLKFDTTQELSISTLFWTTTHKAIRMSLPSSKLIANGSWAPLCLLLQYPCILAKW